MLIIGGFISLLGLIVAYEVIRQRRITRKIEANAKSGLGYRQLVARGMVD